MGSFRGCGRCWWRCQLVGGCAPVSVSLSRSSTVEEATDGDGRAVQLKEQRVRGTWAPQLAHSLAPPPGSTTYREGSPHWHTLLQTLCGLSMEDRSYCRFTLTFWHFPTMCPLKVLQRCQLYAIKMGTLYESRLVFSLWG